MLLATFTSFSLKRDSSGSRSSNTYTKASQVTLTEVTNVCLRTQSVNKEPETGNLQKKIHHSKWVLNSTHSFSFTVIKGDKDNCWLINTDFSI